MELPPPQISVVIPTADRPRAAVESARTALAQTISAIEVIVVIDGPDQATIEALRAVEDPRLRVKQLPSRAGAGAARNAGVAEARAEWVAFLDDDDEWSSRKLEIQLEAVRSQAHRYPVIACRLLAREEDGETIWPRRRPRPGEPVSEYLFTRARLSWGEGFVQTSTILTSRELLERVHFRTDLKKHDDWDWLLRASALHGAALTFAPSSEPLVIWNRDQDRPRRGRPDWRFSVAWLAANRQLVTPRAFASFLLTVASGDAARERGWPAFWLLPWEAMRHGKPRARDLLLHLALWIIPPALQGFDPFRRRRGGRSRVTVEPGPGARRKLAYVLDSFPKLSETFVAAELIELERQGEELAVFALTRPVEPFVHGFVKQLSAPVTYLPRNPMREPLRTIGAALRVMPSDRRGWLRAARSSVWPLSRVGLKQLLQATVLRDELKRAGVDHAHAHFAHSPARLASLAERMGGPGYSVTAHAWDIYHRRQRRGLERRLAHARFVATQSLESRRHLSSILGARARVHVIHNSVDVRRWRVAEKRRPEPRLVLTVARLVEKKGLRDLVAACGELSRRGAPARLRIVGVGPLRRSLQAAAAKEGIAVEFPGALSQERLDDEYRRAAVFSLPCVVAASGDRDALPTSVLEAMATGVPVVTTAVNGLAEPVVHERTGLIVPQHDPIALADAIERLLASPDLGARLAREARRHVEHTFSLERNAALLRTLLQGAGPAP